MNHPSAKSHIANTRVLLSFLLPIVTLVAFLFASPLLAGPWMTATIIPATAYRYAFAQNGEEFYVISGSSNGPIVTTMRRYNAVTNTWTTLANIPVGSEGAAAVYYNGKIYVASGDSAPNAFYIYDVATNVWSVGPARPGAVTSYGAAAGALNGKVYIAGGGSAGPSNTLWIYDIAANTWSAGPALPSAFQLGGRTQIGQFLYLIGGFTGNVNNNSTVSMRLDMATNTWSTGPAFTPQRGDFGLAAAGLRLFAIGGDANGVDFFDPTAEVNELDTSTWPSGTWIASPDNLPTARQGNSAGFFSTGRAGGEIWSTGGANTTSFLSEHLFRAVSVPCQDYNITQSTRPLVPATTDIMNHCDDCVTPIMLPFPIKLYGYTYLTANVSSNGNLQFGSANSSRLNNNLPVAGFDSTVFCFWDDLRTDVVAGSGVFASVTGSAPNRLFALEWRASQFNAPGMTNFEMRFLEGSPDFEILYGASSGTFTGTIGIQRDELSLATQFAGPAANPPPANTRLLFTTGCCAPIAFHGAIGSNSSTYPGTSGKQSGRLTQNGIRSTCASNKAFPGADDNNQRTYDRYSFTNDGPATCVTFSVNTPCGSEADVIGREIFATAYLGNFDPANIATNYLGDIGSSPLPFNSFSVNVPANATVNLVVNEVNAGGACNGYDVVVTGLTCPLELISAVSRKTHGAAGEFDIPLPLTGQPGVECRTSGGNHKLVFTFSSQVVSGSASVTAGVGTAGAASFAGTKMTVPLSGVSDQQKITVTLNGVTDTAAQVLPSTAVSMNVVLGDTNGSKSVNSTDISQTKAQSGAVTTAANFRNDTSVSGTINATDISQVKANSGHGVP